MRLRFVKCRDAVSDLIADHEGDMAKWVGFTPAHVEIVVSEGYLGAHYDGGVQIRKIGYDAATLQRELFVAVSLPREDMADKWARSKIDAPYDWRAIVDYILPTNFHQSGTLICSAFCTGALQNGLAFNSPLARPWHAISPADLLTWLSGRNVDF